MSITTVKISELPEISSANLIASSDPVLPLVANIDGNLTTYKTSFANVKDYIENGDFAVTGNMSVNGDLAVGGNISANGNLAIAGNISANGFTYSNGAAISGGGASNLINATDNTSTTPLYPVMVGAAGSDQLANVTTSKFEFDASSGNLTVAGNLLTTGIDGNISGVVYYLGGNVAVDGNVQGNAIVGNAFTWANGVSIITSGGSGVSGPQGPQGPSGPAGSGSGSQGPQGPQGPSGPAGSGSGSQGPQGPQGVSGTQGPQGPQGPVPSTNDVLTAMAGLTFGAVGTFAWAGGTDQTSYIPGSTYSGLRAAGLVRAEDSAYASASFYGDYLSGTWRALGYTAVSVYSATLFIRIV